MALHKATLPGINPSTINFRLFSNTEIGAGIAVTLTVPQIVGGLITGNPAAPAPYTLPDADAFTTTFPNLQRSDAFQFALRNDGPGTFTLAVPASGTLDGNLVQSDPERILWLLMMDSVSPGSEAYTARRIQG